MKLLKADQDQAEDTDDDDGSVAQLDDQSAADGGAAVAAVVSESTVSSGGGLWASVVAGADGEGQKEDGAAGGGAAAVNVFTHPVVELLIGKLTLEQNTGAGAAADAGAGGGGGGDAEAAVTVGGTDRLHDLQDVHLNVAEVLEDIVYRTSGMLGGGGEGDVDGSAGFGDMGDIGESEMLAATPPSRLCLALNAEPSVVALLTSVLHAGGADQGQKSASAAALRVLVGLLKCNRRSVWEKRKMALGLAAVEDPDRDAALPHVVSVLLGRLPELGEQLDVEGAGAERMRTTFAPDVEKLGVRRLQLVELICELVHSDFDEVFAALAGQGQENLMQLCLDTFFKFEWNNMLHRIVMGALIAIVERGQNEPAPAGEEWKADGEAASAHGGVVALCRSLFVEYNLLDRILQAYRENDEYAKQPKGCQKGYMGFLHHVCNGLVEAADQPVLTDGNDQGGVDADGEGDEGESSDANLILCFLQGHQAWEDFVDTQLEEINRIERTALGGDNAPPASPALAGLPDCGDPPDDDFDIGSGADGGGTAGGSMLEYDMDDFAEEFDEELGSGSRGGAFGPFDDDDSDDDDSDDDDDDDSDDSDDDEMSEALKAQ